MSKVIKIKRGLDIKLQGKSELTTQQVTGSGAYGIKPTDFPNLTPKLAVKEGHVVKAGSALFWDKYKPEVKFTSPVSGKVVAVNRGERRRLLEIVVEPDTTQEYEEFKKGSPAQMSKEEVLAQLLNSGTWPFIRQRPYAIIANPADTPKAIYIQGFDTAPLAPDYAYMLRGRENDFKAGVEALKQMGATTIYLNVHLQMQTPDAYKNLDGVTTFTFDGPHPASTVGVQINNIDPINKGEIVWYIGAQEVAIIGSLFNTGQYNPTKIVAVNGASVKKPQYYATRIGEKIEQLTKGNLKEGNQRIISGNVLVGEKVTEASFLGFYDSHITVIAEGDKPEFLGWGTPGFGKLSVSRTFFSWLSPNKEYALDTNMRGGHRPFVVSGEYEKVVPMDIMPVQLLKAILVEDIDLMEQMGIYEIAEEDLALCEFVCTSKTEVQNIVRKGLDMMIKEFN